MLNVKFSRDDKPRPENLYCPSRGKVYAGCVAEGKDARLAATTFTTTHTCVVVKHTTNRRLEILKISMQAFEACFNDDVNDFFHFLIGL